MSDFEYSFDEVILSEGGYVDDPDDSGGETYLGITRKNHPNSSMWAVIDSIKKQFGLKGITARLKKDPTLLKEAKRIYKTQYWDKLKLDEIPSKKIAHQLFDDAVNRGVSAAIRVAQEVTKMEITGKFSQKLLENLKEYGKPKD